MYRTLFKSLLAAIGWRRASDTASDGPRALTAADLLTPRLSVPGVCLVCLATLVISQAAMMAVYYADIKSELTSEADSRVASFDLLLGAAIGEMKDLPVLEAGLCGGTVIEGLVKASMDSAIARRFYAISKDREQVCSPLSGIGDPAARLLTQGQDQLDSPISVLVIPDASNDVLLVSDVGNSGQVAAQIPGNLIRDLLSLRGKTGIATINIRSWTGGSLLDSGWDEPYGGRQFDDLLSIQRDSVSMPITVRASARTAEVIDGAWRYGLAGLLLAGLIAALVISRINLELEHRSSALSRIRRPWQSANLNR